MTIKHLALVGLVTAAAGGYVAVAAGDDSVVGDPAASQGAPAVDPSTAFAVFRRPASPADAMPARERQLLSTIAERENVSLNRARAVARSAGRTVWALPGPVKACLAIPDPVDGYGVSCATGAEVLDGRLWVALVGGAEQRVGDARVAQLVPDGVEAVTSVSAGGERGSIAVSDNVAFADLTDADRLEFESGDGARSVRIGRTLPAMVNEGR